MSSTAESSSARVHESQPILETVNNLAPLGRSCPLHSANADVFACTHACEPIYMHVDGVTEHRAGVIINNGATGMSNFIGARYGVATRISTRPAATDMPRLYGTVVAGVHIEALALHYNHGQWWSQFEAMGPPGCAANLSHGARIRDGGHLDISHRP